MRVTTGTLAQHSAGRCCHELSHDEKLTVLHNWKRELVQLQKAGEENMLHERRPGEVGSRLAAVTNAIIALEETSRP